MEWISEHAFNVDGVAYSSMVQGEGMVILKPREAIEQYQAMIEKERPRRIVELGIFNGGSTALLAQIATPEKLVAIEIQPQCRALDAFLADHDVPVSAYYGIDQANTDALDTIMAAEFGGPVDLVIDDASHLEEQTRASFNRLFPHLRSGGLYVIEDWSWAHHGITAPDASLQGVTPLSAFMVELMLVAGRLPRMIASVEVGHHMTTVRRGDADLRPDRFNVSRHLDPVGLEMVDLVRGVKSLS